MKFGLKQEDIQAICSVFANYPQISEVLLYGSRAKNTYKQGSDIDLTIKGKDISLTTINRIAIELDELMLPYTFDLSAHANLTNQALLEHINRRGILFYPTQT